MAWSVAALAILTSALFAVSAARRQRREEAHASILPQTAVPHDRDTFRARDSQADGEAESPPTKSCPVCLAEYPAARRFCVHDGASLLDGSQAGPFAQGMICPTCRRGYPGDASFCPEDAEELVPYGLYGAASASRSPIRMDSGKICPECGVRHAAIHAFCGQDGAELVVLN